MFEQLGLKGAHLQQHAPAPARTRPHPPAPARTPLGLGEGSKQALLGLAVGCK